MLKENRITAFPKKQTFLRYVCLPNGLRSYTEENCLRYVEVIKVNIEKQPEHKYKSHLSQPSVRKLSDSSSDQQVVQTVPPAGCSIPPGEGTL